MGGLPVCPCYGRAALCGILRLLTGGHPLPQSILGKPADAEWWVEVTPELTDTSLMNYQMRDFRAPSPGKAGTTTPRDASDSLGWDEPPKRHLSEVPEAAV